MGWGFLITASVTAALILIVFGALGKAVLGLTLILFIRADLLERALGATGINVITRLLGMLLAALAMQFVLGGLRGFGLAG